MSTPESRDPTTVAPEIAAERREEQHAAAWTPAFEGQREPFREGNEAAVTHGARSQKKVEELARQIDADLAERAPWVLDYPEALKAYGRAESVARMLLADLAKVGLYGANGEFRASVLARWATSENTAAKLRDALGLTPRSEAQVARDRAAAAASSVDVVAELTRQGRATRAGLDAADAERVTTAPKEIPALDLEAVTEPDREESTDEDDE